MYRSNIFFSVSYQKSMELNNLISKKCHNNSIYETLVFNVSPLPPYC